MSLTPEQAARLAALLESGPQEPPPPEQQPPPPRVVLPPSPPVAPPSAAPDRKRAQLYSSNRRGFMRSTREEGIRDELSAMTDEARGSPFFDEEPRAASADRLRQLGLKRGGRK